MGAAGNLEGSAVLISGASRGIGAVTAQHLAELGFHVVAGVRKEQDGAALCQAHPGRITPVILDVADPASIDAAVATVAQRLDGRRLHGLINNAGIYLGGPLQYLTPGEIRQMIEVNLLGAMLLTRAALPLLRAARGRVLMHGSAMGLLTPPTIGVYGATKAGMAAISEALRLELAPVGVDVVLIETGAIKTDLTGGGAARLRDLLPRVPEADRPVYEPVLRRIVEVSDPQHAGGEPIMVARVMARALMSDRPRARYRAGLDASLAALLHHMPDRVRDAIQRRLFRVPRRADGSLASPAAENG